MYKFGSFEINLSQDRTSWHRSTYSLLDYLGDLGGLINALRHSCAILVAPMASFTVKRQLMQSVFYERV